MKYEVKSRYYQEKVGVVRATLTMQINLVLDECCLDKCWVKSQKPLDAWKQATGNVGGIPQVCRMLIPSKHCRER